MLAAFAAIAVVPSALHTRKAAIANTALGALALAVCCVGFSTINIENDLNVNVDVWSSSIPTRRKGRFCASRSAPQKDLAARTRGYSETRAAELRSQKAMTETVDELIDDPHVVSAAEATDPDVRPTIIAIMNETYSDISTYPQLEEVTAAPIPFSTYEGTIATGDVYVSAMGGGTCNSEFEFLTGSSMGLLGPGVYPYMLYNLEGVDNMASYLKSIGYAQVPFTPPTRRTGAAIACTSSSASTNSSTSQASMAPNISATWCRMVRPTTKSCKSWMKAKGRSSSST